MHKQHGYHALVLYAKRGVHCSYDYYATPGFAEDYFGKKKVLAQQGSIIMENLKMTFQGENCYIYIFDILEYQNHLTLPVL